MKKLFFVSFKGYVSKVKITKSPMSIKFPPVILGPEVAVLILWAPGIFGFFLLGKVFLEVGGGGSANFIFMGVGIFPRKINLKK